MTRETPLGLLLVCYIPTTFCYAYLCGVLGKTYDPLGAFQVYAVGCFFAFLVSAAIYRPKRFWPPTTEESLAALSSTTILTSSTFSLLLPQSLVAVVASKSGALLLPSLKHFREFPALLWRSPREALSFFGKHLALPSLAVVAVLLSAWRKPLRLMLLPLGLAVIYVLGYSLKLYAVRLAKGTTNTKRTEFLVAEQLVVAVVTLAIAALIHQYRLVFPDPQFRPFATVLDWRLWLVAFASYGGGFVGTLLVLHSTPQSVVFPAYRAASLLCALGASAARGELKWQSSYWSDWAAITTALVVVLWASGAFSFAWKQVIRYFSTPRLRKLKDELLVSAGLWLVVNGDSRPNQ